MSVRKFMIATLFYVPVAASLVHPILGFTASTFMIAWHFRHQPFKRALDQLDSLYRPPTPLDPMELIHDD